MRGKRSSSALLYAHVRRAEREGNDVGLRRGSSSSGDVAPSLRRDAEDANEDEDLLGCEPVISHFV